MNKDEMKMIEEMAKVMCEKKIKCKDCVLEDFYCIYKKGATELYNAGYHRVEDDEVVVKKSELARLKNLELNYEQVYEDYRKLEQERNSYRKVGEDEIVVKKSEYEDLSKDYATINDEAYYCGFSAGVEEAKQETRDILHDLYMCFTEEYLLGFRNSNKDHKSASVVKRLCKAYGIELE